MSKKILIICGTLILVLVILGGFFFSREGKSLLKPLPEAPDSTLPSQERLLLYEDEAGFSFRYPQTLGIVEKDVNDSSVYSSLELSGKSHSGEKLVIKISDTSLQTVDIWLEKNPPAGQLVSSKEFTLASMKGKSLAYANPDKNLILAIDSGILYYLEAPSGNAFWDQTLNSLASSFQLTSQTPGTDSGDSPVIEEKEEVVE